MRSTIYLCASVAFLYFIFVGCNAFPQVANLKPQIAGNRDLKIVQRSRRDLFDFFGGVVEVAGDVVSGVADAVGSVVSDVVDATSNSTADAVADVVNGSAAVVDTVSDVVSDLADEISTLSSVDEETSTDSSSTDVLGDVLSGLGDTIDAVASGVGDAVSTVVTDLADSVSDLSESSDDTWTIVQGIIEAVSVAATAVVSIFSVANLVNVLVFWGEIVFTVIAGIVDLSAGNIVGAFSNLVNVVVTLSTYSF